MLHFSARKYTVSSMVSQRMYNYEADEWMKTIYCLKTTILKENNITMGNRQRVVSRS